VYIYIDIAKWIDIYFFYNLLLLFVQGKSKLEHIGLFGNDDEVMDDLVIYFMLTTPVGVA